MTVSDIFEQEKLAIEAHASFRKLPVEGLFSTEPTKFICILNLGFGGEEASELETIQALVSEILGAERVIANKGWPYIYVAFPRSEFAINAREELNHNSFSRLGGRVLFAQYVTEPEIAY
ncbi:hypothetical protein DSO57_1031544 [Entomophthora muscae]|uniref:Uncharacterized protein n=1 Tax=Entomophthora muscae TaxID=34485 RepID=A0ACC2SDN5_9FUNG|nr:hypothetical protein DSO57_1031544 [Entomophthora muscae]